MSERPEFVNDPKDWREKGIMNDEIAVKLALAECRIMDLQAKLSASEALCETMRRTLEYCKRAVADPNGPLYGTDPKIVDKIEATLAMTHASTMDPERKRQAVIDAARQRMKEHPEIEHQGDALLWNALEELDHDGQIRTQGGNP